MKRKAALEAARAWLWAHRDDDDTDFGNVENVRGAWAVINWALGDAVSYPPWERDRV